MEIQRNVRRGLGLVGVVAGLGVVAVGFTFVKQPLAVSPGVLTSLPAAPAVAGVRLSRITTAHVDTQHGFNVRGAPISAPFQSAMVAFVVDHPQGTILIDAGLGRDGAEHVKTTPALMRALVSVTMREPIAEGLTRGGVDANGLKGVLLTHTHWDHVSGLADLPGVPVWLTQAEEAYSEHDEGAALYRQIDAAQPIEVMPLRLDGQPYGPFATSHDLFDDGSVVVVPMAGHTPGSIGVFVNLPSGRRYLFVGDTTWTEEGVDWPAEKPWLSRRMVDLDAEAVREQLRLLHRLAKVQPEVTVVPAHDARVHEGMAALPEWEM